MLWLVLDIGLRFLPADWLELRPVLAAVRLPSPHGPFAPNLRIYAEHFTGEAALEANIPTRENRPPIHFSTDSRGFRLNPYAPEGKPPEVLVWRGASFTYGASLSDQETLPAQLTKFTGLSALNAGRFFLDPDGLPELDWLLNELPSKPSTVVYVHLEHAQVGGVGQRANGKFLGTDLPDPRQSLQLRYASRVAGTWERMSPFEILFTRAFKSVSNDRILPNPYRRNVQPMHLPDGTDLLMRNYEMQSAARQRNASEIRETGDQLVAMTQELRRRGMDVLVLLLPSRQTLYSPWLRESGGLEAPAHDYLNSLEHTLASTDIAVVNGLDVLRQDMETQISSGDLSFYRDDNHWNPKGVRRVATAVAAALESRALEVSAVLPEPGSGSSN
ncbi:MAG TPA: hypothetical protein VEQ63_14930 [Bryobacteraceae bacterium]|nr:hypothetical protein [Bryobacteraceae bacterium]